jgi:hypothetical protein
VLLNLDSSMPVLKKDNTFLKGHAVKGPPTLCCMRIMVFVFFISLLVQIITLELTRGKIGTQPLITKMAALRSFEKLIAY